jgi:hypothetical protein
MGDLPAQIAKVGEAIRKDPIPTFQTLFTGTGRFFGVLGRVIGITTSVVLFFLLVPVYFFFFAWRFPDIVG